MSNQKIALMVGVALIIGIIIGVGVSSSSTKSNTDQKEIQQSTVQEQSGNVSASPPQKSAGKVEVKSQTRRVGMTGLTEIVGEVINNTQNEVKWVQVMATFYDAQGKVIATNETYAGDTTDTPLAVGATAPFEVTSYPNKIDAASFKLDVTWN